MSVLTTNNHSRDSAGLKYIYPVLSRRAGGVSIGINFNINNACNWRCIYCQVPNLTRGSAPDIDLSHLAQELRLFLNDIKQGDFFQHFQVDTDKQYIKDIAISGNGEPTSLRNFADAVSIIGQIATELGLLPDINFILITNGSLIHQAHVQEGLKELQKFGGEVWFKLDSVTASGRKRINDTPQTIRHALRNLEQCAALCATAIQTCLVNYNGKGFIKTEQDAYLHSLESIMQTANIKRVMLYTLARPSLQPEANKLKPLSQTELNNFAEKIRALGLAVSVS